MEITTQEYMITLLTLSKLIALYDEQWRKAAEYEEAQFCVETASDLKEARRILIRNKPKGNTDAR